MNIHILQTSQPSRLLQCLEVFELLDKEWLSPLGNVNRNIYITNDEKPKEGDWCLDKFNQRWKLDDKKLIAFDIEGIKRFSTDNILGHECKKIIITTDQELIKDGIQAIDDEFLEWFVKNQSCEEVEVINDTLTVGEMSKLPLGARNHKYKTIIPKEEPKRKIDTCYNFDMEIGCVQDICRCEQEEPKQHVEFINNSIDKLDKAIKSFKQDSLNQFLSTSGVMIKDPQKWEIPKQETLEEVATKEGLYRCSQNNFNQAEAGYNAKWFKRGALFGAKWQQEQIGKSEFLQKLRATISDAEARRLIFEQFKNK
jgi:hypothetical protein